MPCPPGQPRPSLVPLWLRPDGLQIDFGGTIKARPAEGGGAVTQHNGTNEVVIEAAMIDGSTEIIAAPVAHQLWLWAGIPVGVVLLVLTDGLLSPWPDFVIAMTAAAVVLGWLRHDVDACWYGPTLSIAPGLATGFVTADAADGLLFVSNALVLAMMASIWTLIAATTGWLSSRRAR